MCDYSLEAFKSREAVIGEKYVLLRFATGSVGFIESKDCNTAICMKEGARLRLDNIGPLVQESLGIGAAEDVEFVRLVVPGHRDAVQFSDGRRVLLQNLNPGIIASVVQRDLEQLLELKTDNRAVVPVAAE